MKRLLSLIVLSCIILTSCGQKNVSSPTVGPTWQEQYDLGVRYLSEGNYEEAIIAFTAAIEIDPKRTESYVGRADAYARSGKNTYALADYETVIDLGSASADVYRLVAEMYFAAGDTDAAMDILRQGIELTGDESLKEWLEELDGPKPLEGYPKSVRGESSVSGYTIKDYNEYGNLVKLSFYTENDELDSYSEYVYDERQTLAMIVNEHFALTGGTPGKIVSYIDSQGRCYKRDDTTAAVVVTYDYLGGTDVEITYYDSDLFGNELERSISYTMEDPSHVVIQTMMSGSLREHGIVVEEYQVTDTYYSGPKTLVKATRFVFNGEGNLLRTEPAN